MAIYNSGSLWGTGAIGTPAFNQGVTYLFAFTNTQISSSEGGNYFTFSLGGMKFGNTVGEFGNPTGIFNTGSIDLPPNTFPEALRSGRVQLGAFMAQYQFPTSDTVNQVPVVVSMDQYQTVGVGSDFYLSLTTENDEPGAITLTGKACDSSGNLFGADGKPSFTGFNCDQTNRWVIPKAVLDGLGLGVFSGAVEFGFSPGDNKLSGRIDPFILAGVFEDGTTPIPQSFVQEKSRFSCFIKNTGDQSFLFTPTTTIPQGTYTLQGTGHYTLTIT